MPTGGRSNLRRRAPKFTHGAKAHPAHLQRGSQASPGCAGQENGPGLCSRRRTANARGRPRRTTQWWHRASCKSARSLAGRLGQEGGASSTSPSSASNAAQAPHVAGQLHSGHRETGQAIAHEWARDSTTLPWASTAAAAKAVLWDKRRLRARPRKGIRSARNWNL